MNIQRLHHEMTDHFFNMRRQVLVICLLLICAVLVSYWQVQYADFAGFDDELYVTNNRHVQAGLTWDNVIWAFTTTDAANWHPLTWLSHMLDCELYGLNPTGHHRTNLLFHMANSLLLFLVFHQMTGAVWRSAFVAALFALHPLNVESVAWISERKNLLSAFFGFLSIAAYIRYAGKKHLASYLLCLLFLCLGLMAKAMLVTLPFVLLLMDFWPLGRFCGKGAVKADPSGGGVTEGQRSMDLVLEKIPFFVPVLFACVTTILDERRVGAVQSLAHFSFSVRIGNALMAYISYVFNAVWPNHLSVFYPHPGNTLPMWRVWGAALFIAGVSVLAIRTLNKYPYIAVGWFWFLGTLVPVIGLVQIGGQAMADRYTYIPLIGLFTIFSWGISDLTLRWTYRKIVVSAFAAMVLAVLCGRTILQVNHWKNAVTLFENAVRIDSENSLAHNNLGTALYARGDVERAVFHFREALRIEPGYVAALTNLATVLSIQGQTEEAVRHFEEALSIDPKYAVAHYHLGILYKKQRKINAAYAHFAEAIKIDPNYAEAYNQIGVILAWKGKLSEADVFFSKAVEINQNFETARKNFENNRKKISLSIKVPGQ
jgi:tetratricopeptide (TPR) repeat protein